MEPRPSLSIVRRVCEDGVVREFVHPPDGRRPVERPVGSRPDVPAPAPASPPEEGHRWGQLIGRNVVAGDDSRPLALPLLRSSCDGSGSCCGTYHHIPMTTPIY